MTVSESDHGATWREEWADAQEMKAPAVKDGSVFYRNIEEELDLSRQTGRCLPLHLPSHTIDFSNCDVLGFGHTGALREEFLKELDANPGFHMGAGGSRLMDGTSKYQDNFEREMAELMGVESVLFVHSGFTANQAIFSTVPRSGDVIVFDELTHATALAGMKVSLALEQRPFRHNDVDHFIEVMESIKEAFPLIKSGKRCVIVGVESYYSMDGDICPLRELIEAAEEIFPYGNAQFVVDEAHSFGSMGPGGGLGFVPDQGLEDKVAIRMFTFGKALAGSGGCIVSNNTVRSLLVNQAKVFICSIAPPFALVAAGRAGISLIQTEKAQKARDYLLYLTRFYLDTLTSHPTFKKANAKGLLRIPIHEDEDWHEREITHIVPIWTKPKHAHYLSFHLVRDGINGTPIVFPIVAKGEDRVRLIMHAHNTEDDAKALVNSICSWAEEMMEIEASGDKNKVPSAARLAFDLVKKEQVGTNGVKSFSGL
ncbi:pyridoxal phosphate-dependent transferase [Massariosphaeria phaeospora]|uniref:Pyridoxal phosphate-dependent transferase n=1 Tax=Massariosphaeria phaeospora TaxID=100035 RepID=A0A7C8IG10_9PLEO|nr:pyridoxal phosphate-dependent transferase [Massariosphaeria phaeospora]